MTRSRKLIVAAALLAGGYGLALVVSGLSDFLWARRLVSGAGSTSDSGDLRFDGSSIGGPTAVGSARLIPERTATSMDAETVRRGDAVATGSPAARSSPSPTWLTPVLQASWTGATNDGQDEPPAAAINVVADRTVAAGKRAGQVDAEPMDPQPRARLTDVKPSGNTTAGRGTPAQGVSASPWDRWPRWEPPAAAVAHATADDRAPANVSAEPASSGLLSVPHDLQASLGGTADVATNEVAELRVHIVVDGDSLPKLADRYLDDPQLGDAIFQLNRDVLSDPELLPIGTELKIPERRMASSWRVGLPSRMRGRPADAIAVDDGAWEPMSRTPRAQLLGPQRPTDAPTTFRPSTSPW